MLWEVLGVIALLLARYFIKFASKVPKRLGFAAPEAILRAAGGAYKFR